MNEQIEEMLPEKITELIENRQLPQLRTMIGTLSSRDTAFVLSRLPEEDQQELLALLSTEEAAELLSELPLEQAADLVQEMPVQAAADVMQEMPDDEMADILADVASHDAEAILEALPRQTAQITREIMKYPHDSAGGIMHTDFLSYRENQTVQDVLEDLEKNSEEYSDYDVQYAYIVNDAGTLTGVLRFRDLLLRSRTSRLKDFMISHPVFVTTDVTLEKLGTVFDDYAFIGIPVIHPNGQLAGVVNRMDVAEAEETREKNIFLRISGIIGGEEFRSMPFFQRSFRRLSWLAPNIILNIIAASVIAAYQDTIQAIIALAVFLPIISDMSGCSGNQAVAVSIRELSLGMIKAKEFTRVFVKEATVGLFNGFILGLLLGSLAYLWQRDIALGGVIAAALWLNTTISVLIGGCVPLLLRSLKFDPALAAGPILTTVTDMCGFFLVLSMASAMLTHLH